MGFQDKHSSSFTAKFLLSTGILAGSLVSAALMFGYPEWLLQFLNQEKLEGNVYRQVIIISCFLIYFIKFIIGMFVFVQRNIGWFEGGFISVLYFMMFYLFGRSAGNHTEPIGIFDILGVFLFIIGCYINTLADYQRYVWKARIENNGRLFTEGLFKYSMHINYFGDGITYIGLALITLELVPLLVSIGIFLNFIVLQIPMLDKYLSMRYEDEFLEYANKTKKLIPWVY